MCTSNYHIIFHRCMCIVIVMIKLKAEAKHAKTLQLWVNNDNHYAREKHIMLDTKDWEINRKMCIIITQ